MEPLVKPEDSENRDVTHCGTALHRPNDDNIEDNNDDNHDDNKMTTMKITKMIIMILTR